MPSLAYREERGQRSSGVSCLTGKSQQLQAPDDEREESGGTRKVEGRKVRPASPAVERSPKARLSSKYLSPLAPTSAHTKLPGAQMNLDQERLRLLQSPQSQDPQAWEVENRDVGPLAQVHVPDAQ